MADKDPADTDDKDPADTDDKDPDESGLSDDAKQLLNHMSSRVRKELHSVLDERLRVENDKPEDKTDPKDGEQDPPKPRSFMERIGW